MNLCVCGQMAISESVTMGLHVRVSMCAFVCLLRIISNNLRMSTVKPIHDKRKKEATYLLLERKQGK